MGRVRVRWDHLGVSLLLACGTAMLRSQSSAPTAPVTHTGQPPSVQEVLAGRGIKGREQVVQALMMADPELRSMAAIRLEEEKDPDAAALIHKALDIEEDPVVVVNFASMLWALGDAEGQMRLEAICRDAPSRDILMRAAEQLSFRHKGGLCARALLDDYRKGLTSAQLLETLSLLQAIAPDAAPENKAQMRRLADEESRSPDLHLRVEARHLSRELK